MLYIYMYVYKFHPKRSRLKQSAFFLKTAGCTQCDVAALSYSHNN